MQKAQTSIEYLLLIGGVVTLIVAISVLIYSSISTPQQPVHCSFSTFSNLARLGATDININKPNSCIPITVDRAKGQTINTVVPGGIELWVGAADCDSTNTSYKKSVGKISLFLVDWGNKIVCTDGGSTSYLNQQFSLSIVPTGTNPISPGPNPSNPSGDSCINPQKLYFSLSSCTPVAGHYDLRVIASPNPSGGTSHSDIEPKAIIIK